eukprot:s5736_g2.t1
MSNQLDSKPHFAARAQEYGLTANLLRRLSDHGIDTFGQLAFAVFRPGSDFDEVQFNQWARQVNNDVAPTLGELASLRRLHFESEIVATSVLRSNVESTDQTTPKTIPLAERSARLTELKNRLQGLSIQGSGEPSHALLDEACNQYETKVLRHIDPVRCTSRETEVVSSKTHKHLKLDASTLTVKENKTIPDESISTTYHLAQCLRRRGLAYDFAGLITFQSHEKYSEKLLRHLSIEAPPGYHATTLAQVLKADKEVFSYLAQNCEDIRPSLNVKPLDAMLTEALQDYNTTFHLLPLPKAAGRDDSYVQRKPTGGSQRTEDAGAPYRPKGKSKGKGKSKNAGGSHNAPQGMVGCVGRDAKNRAICFNYNLNTCDKAPAGGTCPRGRHVCFKAGCFKVHSYKEAHASEMGTRTAESLLQPDGLDGLSGTDAIRVGLANTLYSFVAECYDLCCSLNKLAMVENPANSLFWFTSMWVEREYAHRDIIQDHQACGYGSLRPKWTRLVANFNEVKTINLKCPGNHKHAAWGVVKQGAKRVFATALEVHYPNALCDAISYAFMLQFMKQGYVAPAATLSNSSARIFSGLPATSSKAPAFVPEHKTNIAVIYNAQQVWPSAFCSVKDFKLLHTHLIGGVGERDANRADIMKEVNMFLENWKVSARVEQWEWYDGSQFSLKNFGVCWNEDEFVDAAMNLLHPLAPELAMPEVLLDEMRKQVVGSNLEVARDRAVFFKRWTDRACALAKEESELRSGMDKHVMRAVAGKKLLVFREMLEAYNYPDVAVCDELEKGAELIGEVHETAMLPRKYVPALCSEEELAKRSEMVRATIMAENGSSGDSLVDEEVWNKTLDEVAKGWLLGPLDDSDVPLSSPISRRFGLVQKKNKVRLIDDFSESGVNACVTVVESPVLHTIDIACAFLQMWFSCCHRFNVSSALVTRTFDLTSAYRQVGLSTNGRRFAYLRVYDPGTKRLRLFQATVLPFGAVKSVHTFLRCARALWWLGVIACRLLWTSFYDDYICFSQPDLQNSSQLTVAALFKLTGWLFAETGDKCKPFDECCEALGVLFNLSQSGMRIATVHNTASRIEELCAFIDKVMEERSLNSKTAQRLRGRMQFADSQIYGKVGKRCMRVLADFSECRRTLLLDKDIFFLKLFREMLVSDRPRSIRPVDERNALIFTDACYEKENRDWPCGLGGVLLLPDGRKAFFSLLADESVRICLGERHKKQIIFEAETLAALVALKLWKDDLDCFRCFFFVDNEGSKFSLLKGCSDNKTVDLLAEEFVRTESQCEAAIWISRVPSKSNISDEPSRGIVDKLLKKGFRDDTMCAMSVLADVLRTLDVG